MTVRKSADEDIYVDGTTACVKLRTHSRRLAGLVEAGAIESIKIPGGRRKYSLRSLESLIEKSRTGEPQRSG